MYSLEESAAEAAACKSGRARSLDRSSAVSDAFRTTYDLPGSPTVPKDEEVISLEGCAYRRFENVALTLGESDVSQKHRLSPDG